MKKALVLVALLSIFNACTKEETGSCISNCNASTPGKINIAIENHTDLDIKNVVLTINNQLTPFNSIPKARQGSYSCWKTFDKIDFISFTEFNIGSDSIYSEVCNYKNLSRIQEYSMDIRMVNDVIRIQLTQSPSCVSDAD